MQRLLTEGDAGEVRVQMMLGTRQTSTRIDTIGVCSSGMTLPSTPLVQHHYSLQQADRCYHKDVWLGLLSAGLPTEQP